MFGNIQQASNASMYIKICTHIVRMYLLVTIHSYRESESYEINLI